MEEVIKTLAQQVGPVGGSLIILLSFVIGLLWNELRKSARHCEKSVKEEREKLEKALADRIEDAKAITLALRQSAEANLLTERASDERVAAIRDLTNAVREAALKMDVRDERFLQTFAKYDQRLENIDRSLARAP